MEKCSCSLCPQAFTSASQGLLNCLVYGWTQQHFRSLSSGAVRDANTQTPLLRSQKRNYAALRSAASLTNFVWHTSTVVHWPDALNIETLPVYVFLRNRTCEILEAIQHTLPCQKNSSREDQKQLNICALLHAWSSTDLFGFDVTAEAVCLAVILLTPDGRNGCSQTEKLAKHFFFYLGFCHEISEAAAAYQLQETVSSSSF